MDRDQGLALLRHRDQIDAHEQIAAFPELVLRQLERSGGVDGQRISVRVRDPLEPWLARQR